MAVNRNQNGPHVFQGSTGAPTGYKAVVAPAFSMATTIEDIKRHLLNMHRCGLWHKCLHADLLDGYHVADIFEQVATELAIAALSSVVPASGDLFIFADISDGNANKQATLAAINAVLDHGTLAGLSDDDHSIYLLASAATDRATFASNWTDLTDTGATTLHKHDHGGMDGLGDDDHTQYMLDAGTSTANAFPKFTNTDGRTMSPSGVICDASDNLSGIGSISRNGLIDDKGQCRVYRNTSAQAVVATTWTKIQFNAETFDTDSYFESTTDFRYTPTKAGKYTVRARLVSDIDAVEWTADPTGQAFGIAVYKNGAAVAYGIVGAEHNGKVCMTVSDEQDMNGSTDYLEIYAYTVSGCNITNGSAESYASFERVD